jgi:O-antigen ligase
MLTLNETKKSSEPDPNPFMRSRTQKIFRLSEVSFLAAIFFLPFSKALLEIFLVVSIVAWLYHKLVYEKTFCGDRWIFVVVGLFVITSSISAFTAGYPMLSARGLIKLLKYSLILLIAMDLFQDTDRLKRLLIVSLLSLSVVIADAFIQRFYGADIFNHFPIHLADKQIRLTGPYKSYGLLGAHLIALLPLVFSLTFYAGRILKSKKALLLSLLLIASLYILYKTHSRGAWLAALASWFLYTLILRNKIITLVLIGGMAAVPFVLPRNALLHLDFFNKEATLIERNLLWSRALQVILAKPLFGCGVNTYVRNYPKHIKDKDWRLFNYRADPEDYKSVGPEDTWRIPGHDKQIPKHYVHNGYLHIAAETGLISLSLFLLLIVRGLVSGYTMIRRSEGKCKLMYTGLLVGFVALLLHAAVDTTLQNLQSAVLIWSYLGILISVGRSTSNASQKNL